MDNEYIIKKVFRKYLLISLAGMIVSTIGAMLDGLIISNYLGEVAMAAFVVVAPLIIIIDMIGNIFVDGAISLCAMYIGNNNAKRACEVFTATIMATLLIAIVYTGVCALFAKQLVGMLGFTAAIAEEAVLYIYGMAISIVPVILAEIVIKFVKLDGSPDLIIKSVVSMVSVNLLLDLGNVYVFNMGMFGMAFSNAFGSLVALLILCVHFTRGANVLRIVPVSQYWQDLLSSAKIGMLSVVYYICIMLRTFCLNFLLAASAGSVALTAFSIENSLNSAFNIICFSAGVTTLLLSGVFYGETDQKTLVKLIRIALKKGFLLTSLLAGAGLLLLRPIVGLFGASSLAVENMAIEAVGFLLLSLPVYTINLIFANYYQGVGKLAMGYFICIGGNCVFTLTAAIALLPVWGVTGIWSAFLISEIIMFMAFYAVVWFKNKKIPVKINDFLFIEDDFGVAEDMQINISLANDMAQVVDLAKKIIIFCESRGVEKKKAYHLSLCIEEMAGNVIAYAFNDNQQHFVDILIQIKADRVVFRMRDDGIPFNPLRQLSDNEADLAANIGIRIVKNISLKTDYRYTFGLNNLLVEL